MKTVKSGTAIIAEPKRTAQKGKPMSDLIDRQKAITAICEDGTWLERQGCTEITMCERKQRDADILSELPTIDSVIDQIRWERDTAIEQLAEIGKGLGERMDDVVKVVRCKDCKYYNYIGICNETSWAVTEDSYCCWAERRQDAEKL